MTGGFQQLTADKMQAKKDAYQELCKTDARSFLGAKARNRATADFGDCEIALHSQRVLERSLQERLKNKMSWRWPKETKRGAWWRFDWRWFSSSWIWWSHLRCWWCSWRPGKRLVGGRLDLGLLLVQQPALSNFYARKSLFDKALAAVNAKGEVGSSAQLVRDVKDLIRLATKDEVLACWCVF